MRQDQFTVLRKQDAQSITEAMARCKPTSSSLEGFNKDFCRFLISSKLTAIYYQGPTGKAFPFIGTCTDTIVQISSAKYDCEKLEGEQWWFRYEPMVRTKYCMIEDELWTLHLDFGTVFYRPFSKGIRHVQHYASDSMLRLNIIYPDGEAQHLLMKEPVVIYGGG